MSGEFSAPALDYGLIWPVIVVLGAGCVGVLLEAFAPRALRHYSQVWLAIAAIIAALVGTIGIAAGDGAGTTAAGALVIDRPGLVLWGLILVLSLGGVLLFADRKLEGGVTAFAGQAAALPGTSAEREAANRRLAHTEVFPLMMFAVGGMMLFPVAGDMLLLFVALEVLSLPLYLLTGLARRRRLLSQEAALKYFLLGAFSSGFFLYGLALIYGYSGSLAFDEISAVVADEGRNALLVIGIGLMAVGLLFKVGAAPFHSWTPDVYQGAPTPVTAWMSAATKVAAFGALLRLFYTAFAPEVDTWRPAIALIAVLTMLLGAVLAVVQTDVKRMLGYSAVAHTGFLLAGMVGFGVAGATAFTSTEAVLFYLVAYGVASLGAFTVVSLVRGKGGEVDDFDRWAGLGRRSPWTAAIFALFLLSMAGIPLTAGFVGKWAVLAVALEAGQWPVVILAITASVIAVFFYVRFILLMYFTEPDADVTPGVVAVPSLATSSVVVVAAIATVALGLVPGPILAMLADAGGFLG